MFRVVFWVGLILGLYHTVSAQSTFTEYIKGFKPKSLPYEYRSEIKEDSLKPIPKTDLEIYFLKPAATTFKALLPKDASTLPYIHQEITERLTSYKKNNHLFLQNIRIRVDSSKNDTYMYYYGGKFNLLPNVYSVTIIEHVFYSEGFEENQYLVNYANDGTILDIALFCDHYSGPAGIRTSLIKFKTNNEFAQINTVTALDEKMNPKQSSTRKRYITKIGSNGKFTFASLIWESFPGEFKEEKTGEVLILDDTNNEMSFYHLVNQNAPRTKLKLINVDRHARSFTLQFPDNPKDYFFMLTMDGLTLTVKNPDGTVQTYKRISN